MRCGLGFIIAIAFLFVEMTHTLNADNTIQVVIETRILDGDPQAGMKSRHVVHISFDEQKVRETFETGTTKVFGVELSSVRNNFMVSNIAFSSESVSFSVKGETASGVGVVPNINYEFAMTVKRDGTATVSGCHDGYPAYSITVNGKQVYSFKHKSLHLLNLFGSCDIKI